jgi:type IV secretion system protein VirB6
MFSFTVIFGQLSFRVISSNSDEVCTSGGASMVGGFIGGSLGAWSVSKSSIQRPMSMARQGFVSASTLVEKGKQMRASSKAMFKQMHKNLRRGG